MGSLTTRGLRFVLIAAIWASPILSAPRLPFRNYRTGDGLPQSQVLTLHQDSRGELWVGTWNGAARYDGAEFRYLTLRQGLPSTAVFDIVEAENGDLYLASGAAIARIGKDRSRVKDSDKYFPKFPGSEHVWLRDLYIDRSGVIWAAAQGGGIAVLDHGRLRTLGTPNFAPDFLQVLTETAEGELLLGTTEGVLVIEDAGLRRWWDAPGPWNRPITLLHTSSDGSLVIGTTDGLWRLQDGTPEEITAGGEPILASRSVLIDRLGQLWVATSHGVYCQMDDKMIHLGSRNGLPGDGPFYALHEDREGNLWLGSDWGLTLHPGHLFRVFIHRGNPGWESVWSVARESTGNLLVGTLDGVLRFDGENFSPLSHAVPLRGKKVRSLIEGPPGQLWFGTHNDGLFHWNGRDYRQYLPPEIPSRRIYAIFRGSNGHLWFGTRHGLACYRGDGFDIWTSEDGLPSDIVLTVAEDAAGRIVAGTSEGLARLGADRTIEVPSEFEEFVGVPVRSLTLRRDSTLWVGTEGLGLYGQVDGEWRVFQAGEGPMDNFAWGLVEDENERLWLATNRGLDFYDHGEWVHFSRRDGLVEDELAANAALATPDGFVWFGFPGGGLVRFPPAVPPSKVTAPVVRITSVKTAEREVFEEPFELELPWSERDVSFAFIAISLRDEEEVIYRTMLEGYDADYGPSSPERSMRYTNLGPGSYRFLILAAGDNGIWIEEPVTVDLVILPPFYRTWWFYGLATAAVIAAAVALHGLRLRAIARENKFLESKVEEALARVRTLSGLLPICSHCNQIRDGKGAWNRLESYIEGRTEASFSHSVCPSCARELYAEYYTDDDV